jgi:hypothetical protein
MISKKTKKDKKSEVVDFLPMQPQHSPETQARLTWIALQITANKANIAYLHALASGGINLRKTGCTREIRRYRRTREDEQRLPKTILNLRQQINWLEREREVLKIYGH